MTVFTKLQKAFMQVIIETENNVANATKKIAKYNEEIQDIIKNSPSASKSKKESLNTRFLELGRKIQQLQENIAQALKEVVLANQHVGALSKDDQQLLRAEVLKEMAATKTPEFNAIEATIDEINRSSPGSSPTKSISIISKQSSDSRIETEKTGLLRDATPTKPVRLGNSWS